MKMGTLLNSEAVPATVSILQMLVFNQKLPLLKREGKDKQMQARRPANNTSFYSMLRVKSNECDSLMFVPDA